jgi:hypothetical protein
VDDSPSARSSARVDAENFHAMTLGTGPDVPAIKAVFVPIRDFAGALESMAGLRTLSLQIAAIAGRQFSANVF